MSDLFFRVDKMWICKCSHCNTKTCSYKGVTHIGLARTLKVHKKHIESPMYNQQTLVSTNYVQPNIQKE